MTDWKIKVRTAKVVSLTSLYYVVFMHHAGVNEHGHNVEIKERFDGNSDCQNSYKNYMCYLNFPRCDQEGRSLIMCRTTCKNYFKSCKVSIINLVACTLFKEIIAVAVRWRHEEVWRSKVFRSGRSWRGNTAGWEREPHVLAGTIPGTAISRHGARWRR